MLTNNLRQQQNTHFQTPRNSLTITALIRYNLARNAVVEASTATANSPLTFYTD